MGAWKVISANAMWRYMFVHYTAEQDRSSCRSHEDKFIVGRNNSSHNEQRSCVYRATARTNESADTTRVAHPPFRPSRLSIAMEKIRLSTRRSSFSTKVASRWCVEC